MLSLYSSETVISQVPDAGAHGNRDLLKFETVLEFVADHDCELTLNYIADGLGLPKPTVRRLLHPVD